MQVGVGREMIELDNNIKVSNSLSWRKLPEGGQVASITITSHGAKAIRVGIKITELPQETEFRFFSPNTKNTERKIELVTGKKINETVQLNLHADDSTPEAKTYWSPSVTGESIGIEIYLPSKYNTNDIQISLPSVLHIYTSFDQILSISKPVTNWPGPALTCQNDILCYSQFNDTRKTVAGMSFVKSGGSYVCTGTLLNDINKATWIPYFVTANHCISSQVVASTLETHWFHESSYCNSPSRTSNYTKRSGGAKLLSTVGWNANSKLNGDATLLQLNQAPPPGTWFAGWTTVPPAKGSIVTGIHHPKADLKKISFATYRDKQICTPTGGSTFSCYSSSSGFFVRTNYYDGTTEEGSSGSGLFNTSGQVVGILKGGDGTCYDSNAHGIYTEFVLPYVIGSWDKWLYTMPSGMPWLNLLLSNKNN